MKNLKNFSERLNAALSESGITQADLAKKIDISRASISQMLGGKIAYPSSIIAIRLCEVLNVDIHWLIFGTGTMRTGADPEFVSIPIYDVKASCGTGIENFLSEQSYKQITIKKDWLRANCRFNSIESLSIVTAYGDSMRPTIEDGDLLLIDNSIRELRGDAIYICLVNGELYTKRVQKKPNGEVLMKSDNTVYETYKVQAEDNFEILGKVIRRWTSLPV